MSYLLFYGPLFIYTLTVKINPVETGSKKTSCVWKSLFNTPPQSFKMSQDCRYIMTAESRKPAAYDAPCGDGAVYADQCHLC